MNIHSCIESNVQVVEATGRVDSENAINFEEKLRNSLEHSATGFVLDLSELEYMASAGMRAILLVAKELDTRKIQFALAAVPKPILEVLKIAGFLQLMEAFPSREEAIDRFIQQ
ncbi:MAG: STAS domain-containing protein [Gammaproteobacteria bacterium]|nr:STAS domain-containing protein [Gammaproteobacteria bacterium]